MNLNEIYSSLVLPGHRPEVYDEYLQATRAAMRRGWILAGLAILLPLPLMLSVGFGYLPENAWYTSPFFLVAWCIGLWAVSVYYALLAIKRSKPFFDALGLKMGSPKIGSTLSEYTDGQIDDNLPIQAFLVSKNRQYPVKIGLGQKDSIVLLTADHLADLRAESLLSHYAGSINIAQIKSIKTSSQGIMIHRHAPMIELPWLYDLWLAEKIANSHKSISN
ncbi:hypothetical protein IT411_00475 [Candidatus Peregrinibacteria bacterium]|nr:hypothetical protein [Candidatus Peregrinibacteria bacterium]